MKRAPRFSATSDRAWPEPFFSVRIGSWLMGAAFWYPCAGLGITAPPRLYIIIHEREVVWALFGDRGMRGGALKWPTEILRPLVAANVWVSLWKSQLSSSPGFQRDAGWQTRSCKQTRIGTWKGKINESRGARAVVEWVMVIICFAFESWKEKWS